MKHQRFFVLFILMAVVGAMIVSPQPTHAAGTVTTCSNAALNAAVAGGGLIDFNIGAPCTVVVNPTILITVDTTFQNSSNFNVTLRTLGSRRIFDVTGVGITFNLDGMAGGGTGGITLSDGNGAGGGGGGGAVRSLNATSTVNIEDIVFVSNFAITSSGGGSIRNAGIMNITNSSFTDSNTNGTGGDILNSGTMTVTGSTFFSANATGFGGSIFTTGNLTVTGSTFNANQSGSGGGAIRIAGGDVNIVNSIFIDNTAPGSGQALSIDLATPAVDVSGTTFTNNNCVIITGSFNDLGGNIRDAASAGCAGIIPVALSASAVCNGANLDVTITAGDANFNITGAGPNLPQNGVTTGTTTVTGPGSWTGVTVTETGGDAESLNLGNFTCLPVYTVSTCDFVSLQTAVTNANATGGTINFTCSGTITLSSVLGISNNVTINENGQNVVLDGGGTTRHFSVGGSGSLTLNDLTLQNGNAGGSDGGAINNISGNLTVNNVTFDNNDASSGGAIYTSGGTATINNSTFTNNGATNAGGAVWSSSATTITNSDFTGNSATGFGGGVFVFSGTTTINGGSTFTNNISGDGGALVNNAGTINSQNVTYTNNTCTGTITDNGGNVRNSASVGCPGTLVIDLLVLPLACAGNNMAVNIAMGDPNFNITGTGPGLPLNNVGTGSHIITGAATWTGVTVTELTGDAESVNLGDISCPPVISITTCDFATLQAAVGVVNAGGGTINFACSGTINFTNTLTIASNVIINENGNNVIFDGGNSVRHFGINAGATLTLNDFTLQNGNDGGLGGGSIINSGTLIANNNTFTNNIGGYGGALYNTGSVTLTGNVFSNNTASGNGGALFSSGTLTSTNDDYLNNTASWGGGLSNFGGSANMTLTNADIMNNHATQYGGGMINEGPLSIINSNFSNNTAATVGAGLANYFLSSSQGTTYTNNACDLGAVITNNGGNMSTASPNCPGPLSLTASAVCNGDNLDVTITSGDSNYNITAVSGPGLPLNNVSNGVHSLTGPAAWDDVTVTELSFDNEGVNLGDFICSVGPMTYTVSTCDFASLQTAVANANASPAGGIINFTCSGTITLTSELAITNNVTINENGQTVVLDGGNSNRIFNVNGGGSLTLNDLTLQNGSAGAGDGGLIYNNGILITNNTTFTGGSALRGGAIHTAGAGTSTVNTSTFSGNLGNYGGAIHNYGTTTVNGSTFSGNGNGGTVAGGAIYNEFGILNIGAGSTFTGNQAEYGGAIYDFIGTTTITNAFFSNNVATTDTTTGAIQNEGTVNSQNVTYTNNTCGGANVITDNGGNVRDGASVGCPGITDLVTSASCVGLDLQVVITDGDGAFDITASSGGGLPLISVASGTYLISGTGIWTNVQVIENGGDNQTDSLGDFNCSTPLVVNHACNGLDYEITVVSGDGTVNITGTGTGLPLNNVAIPNTYTLSAPGPWTGVTVTETAGNTEVFIIGDVSCTTALNATLSCVGNDLVVDILGGDGAFNINGTGNGLPLSAVVANTYTFTGPGSWTGVSVVELGGDAEFTAPADFNCFTPVALNASAVCIGDALQVTISGGNGNFNITSTTGTGLPLNNVIADVYTLTGPAAWTGVTVTELSGDLESTNLGDFTCQIPLMASAMCDANGDLTISIGNGDANFTITGTGFGLPIASSGTGSFTIDADALGVNSWTGVTITEIGFNGESVNLGDFNCNVPLGATAVCNGVDLDITIDSGDVSFNITDGATPLQSGVGLGVTTLTGPVVVTNLTITETGGDGQSTSLGAYNCSNALNANVTCVGDDLVVTIVSGDTPFNINGSGAGLPLSGVATGSYTLTGPNVWTGVSVVEVGGDTQSINFGDFTCQIPLVASAMCVNGSLDVTITGGDANFNITGTGASLPMNNVGVGVHTLTEDALGVNSWTGVTVSEIGFNGESIVLGDFNCNVPLGATAVCNGVDLDITVTSGDATFNFTADSGPLGNLGGLATFTITGPVTENNVTVTETSGDMQAINLGNFNCSSDLAATATCDVNGDLAINITAGDGAIFDITGTGNGMPTTGGMGINTFFGNNQGPNAWTGVIVSELSGDFDILNLGDTICNRPLNVTAVCLGDNLQVTINAGDASFDIADGVTALPAGTGVGLGTITFTGPINVADLTITEATGDTQNISLGAFNCFVSNALTATATCNGSDLDITISNGNAPFTINVTDSVGVMSFTGQPLGVYNFTGPDTFSNISVVEEGGDLETLVLADVTCPLPVPVAPVAVVLPPDPNALGCAITTEVNIPLAPDNTYCRVLMRDNGVVGYAGAVPQELINLGVIFAVDVYRLNGGQYVTTFPDYTRICLNGAGRLFYMDSRNSPRGIIELTTETEGNLTCGWIPAPGTLILTS